LKLKSKNQNSYN